MVSLPLINFLKLMVRNLQLVNFHGLIDAKANFREPQKLSRFRIRNTEVSSHLNLFATLLPSFIYQVYTIPR